MSAMWKRFQRLLFLFFGLAASAPSAEARPRLVVYVVGDQWRADYTDLFQRYLSDGGFRKLITEGTYFSDCAFDHAHTATGPGHVLIGSGLYGSESGIPANRWWDREQNKVVSCADRVTFSSDTGVRLRWMIGPSLAQQIKRAYPHSRLIGLALKDRGALLIAGSGLEEAYWVNSETGKIVTATGRRPPWLMRFQARLGEWLESHPVWTLLPDVPPQAYEALTFQPPQALRRVADHDGLGITFPHPIASLKALTATPFGNDLLELLAEETVRAWRLGENETGEPDVLTVSFSATDLIGHSFGPDSPEVMDAFLRLDRTLARLMGFLEGRLGKDRILWVVTSDHGITSFPEVSRARGLEAGRVVLEDGRSGRTRKMRDLPAPRFALERAAAQHLGYTLPEDGTMDDALIRTFLAPTFYLNDAKLAQEGIPREKALAFLKNQLKMIPGVQAAYGADEISISPQNIRRSFFSGRSGDLYVVLKPRYVLSRFGTDHGQPHPDDARVPLFFYGRGIAARHHHEPVSPRRILIEISAHLGITRSRD